MVKKKSFRVNVNGLESEYWAFFDPAGEIDIVPTVIFGDMLWEYAWASTTKETYATIVQAFFQTLCEYNTTFKDATNQEILGFLQAYYLKNLPFQQQQKKKKPAPISVKRMKTVQTLLRRLFATGEKLGFCATRRRSYIYKHADGVVQAVDDADRIQSYYIKETLFETLLEHVDVNADFERGRDQLALRIGYECGTRTEELVRSNNFAIDRLKTAQLSYKIGDEITWKIIGKGKDGGKSREILIKPKLAERIFDFLDKYDVIYANASQFFCQKGGVRLSESHGTNVFFAAKHQFNDPHLNLLFYHALRHSYATNLAEWCVKNNVNQRLIQDRLGHNDAAITAVYVEVWYEIDGNHNKSQEMRMVRHDKRNQQKNKKSKELQDG